MAVLNEKLPQFQGLAIVRADSLSQYNGLPARSCRKGTVNIIRNSSIYFLNNDKSKCLVATFPKVKSFILCSTLTFSQLRGDSDGWWAHSVFSLKDKQQH